MKILMLAISSIAADVRIMREARTLVQAGHQVHIIGRGVPEEFKPGDGITISSFGASSVFRHAGAASLKSEKMSPPVKLARWILLPQHRESAFRRWRAEAYRVAQSLDFDVVHAHDFNTLACGAALANEHHVPYIYDTHEYWLGMARQYRPTPLLDRATRRQERQLGGAAAQVITVSDGIANQLHRDYGWAHINVVKNTFQLPADPPTPPEQPVGVIYAGRLAPHRDLETLAEASRLVDVPVQARGPVDATWLANFDRGLIDIQPPVPLDQIADQIRSFGLSLITLAAGWKNHELTIPNKVFQAVALGIPVVAADVGELGRLVKQHGIGKLYEPGNPESLAQAIRAAIRDYAQLASMVIETQTELNWNTDATRLLETYRKLPVQQQGPRKE